MPHPTSSPRYVAIPGARIILHNTESSFFSNGTGMWTALRETYTVPGTCSENTRAGSLPSAIHVFRYDYYRAAIYEGSREKLPRQARETTRIICERILFRISWQRKNIFRLYSANILNAISLAKMFVRTLKRFQTFVFHVLFHSHPLCFFLSFCRVFLQ